MVNFNILPEGFRRRSKKEELALVNVGHFHEYVFGETLAKFQWEWCEAYHAACKQPSLYSPLVLLCPRMHGKTTWAESVILHRIGNAPHEVNQVISAAKSAAQDRVKRVGGVIREDERYQQLFGDLYPGNDPRYTWSDAGEAIDVKQRVEAVKDLSKGPRQAKRDPTLRACGITTKITGARAHFQLFDDMVDLENSKSEIQRIAVKEHFEMTYKPMLHVGGIQVVIGTRWHYDDLYAHLIQQHDREGKYTALYMDRILEEQGIA